MTRRVDNNSRRHEHDAINTYGVQLEVLSQPTPHYRITSGLEYYADRVYSRAWTVDVATVDTQPQRSTYPDGARSANLALFSMHSWMLDRWILNYGVRLNTVRVQATDETFGSIKNAPTALVGNAGVSYALHGRVGLQWDHRAGWNARGEWRYAAPQRRLSGGDINDHRIADDGTDAWQIINMYVGYTHARFGVNVGLQNLLDRSYRTHGSGVDGYGRSGWVAVRWHF